MNYELDVLRDVSERLTSGGIRFMVTGSVAMGYYAEPRMTRDIDLVVALTESHVDAVVRLFEQDYYVDEQAVARAIARSSVFNIIHTEKVVKVDFIVLKREAYQQEEFARRRLITMAEFQTWIVTREDLILSKMCRAKDSRSEMQLRDVRNLLAGNYDEAYVRSQAQALGVGELLEEVLAQNE
jgi:hypothetical protein